MSRFTVRKVAVLGAGVMGAQIAAHLVNVKVPVVLFDLPAKEGPKNGIVLRAVENLRKMKPSPLGVSSDADRIVPANYEDDLAQLKDCDLIIEAIAERMDWKRDLYAKIAPHVGAHTLFASNTSGLSITALSDALPEALRTRFCGIHFFNPPRYMSLVELIATSASAPTMLDQIEAFVTSTLGKGVVRAKDTPNFVANRIGVVGMLSTMHEVERFGLTYDVVDDLTGKRLGRASSGTFRTADVVGLDTMAHVIKTLQDTLSAKTDPFYGSFGTPEVLKTLIEKGQLGQKPRPVFTKKWAATSCALTWRAKITCPAVRRPTRSMAACSKNPQPSVCNCCATAKVRKASSCGRFCATVSTTPRCTWPRSPRPRATWTWPCAGALA